MQRLKDQLIRHEALVLKPYKDSVGKWTIGVGRNLTDNGITADEALYLLDNDIKAVLNDLDREFPWWRRMNATRRDVLANMCFNLGITRLKGFKKALSAMQRRKWAETKREMLDSRWAVQVGSRAQELASQMETGRE